MAKKAFISLTGGLNDIDRPDTLEDDQLQECVNYEIAGVGRLKKRTDPSVYDTDLDTLLTTLFDDGINSISEPFYPPVKPEGMISDFILVVDGNVMDGFDSVRQLEVVYNTASGWVYQDANGDSFFQDLRDVGIVYTDVLDITFTIATNRVVITDGENEIHQVFVSADDKKVVVSLTGIKAPTNKPRLSGEGYGGDFDNHFSSVSYTESADEGIGVVGLIQCQYTVVTEDGEESNPSPLSDTLWTQLFEIADDGLSDNRFLSYFTVYDLNIPDVPESTEERLKYFNIYYRIIKYSAGIELEAMEFSEQVRIVSHTTDEYDTGNTYVIDTAKTPGQAVSYENDAGIAAVTSAENTGIIMAGNINKKNFGKKEFENIAPVVITNNNGKFYVDAAVHLRLHQNDFKNSDGSTTMPSWSQWFSIADGSIDDSMTSQGLTWEDSANSNHIRIYDSDLTTPLAVIVPDVYDDENYLEIIVKIPLLPAGTYRVYICWNTEIPSTISWDLPYSGIADKYNNIGVESDTTSYVRDPDIDPNPYGWYNKIGFNYGRWSLNTDPPQSQRVFTHPYVRDGGTEFLANTYAKELNIGSESVVDGFTLKNVANLGKSGQPITSHQTRFVDGFGYFYQYAIDNDFDSYTDIGDDFNNSFNVLIGVAHYPKDDNIHYPLGLLPTFFPMPGVSTNDADNYLKLNTSIGDTFYTTVLPDWDEGGMIPLAKYKRKQSLLVPNTTVNNGWDGSTDNASDHYSYGAFMPFCSGWQMQDLAQDINDFPDKSFTRVSLTFSITDIVGFVTGKLDTSADDDGWYGGEYGDTMPFVLGSSMSEVEGESWYNYPNRTGKRGWRDWVIFHWSVGESGVNPESSDFGHAPIRRESPIFNRGLLFLEIRRTSSSPAAVNPSMQKYELLLTYEHWASDGSIDANPHFTASMGYSQKRESIVLDDNFVSNTVGDFSYTGSDSYKTIDVILSLDTVIDKGYLYMMDKSNQSSLDDMDVKYTSFDLNRFEPTIFSQSVSSGIDTSTMDSWRGKKFYDMGLGISYGINILATTVDDDGEEAPYTQNMAGEGWMPGLETIYDYPEDWSPGDDLESKQVVPFNSQDFVRYTAAHCFIHNFEFNGKMAIDSRDKAFNIFNGLPIPKNEDSVIGMSYSKWADGNADWYNKNIRVEEIYSKSAKVQENMVVWSELNKTAFPDLNYKLLKEPIKKIIAAPSFLQFEYSNTFLIFTRNTINRFVLKGDATGWAGSSDSLIEENTQLGLYADKTLVKVGKDIFWLSEEGVIRWSSEGMINISKNVIDVGDEGSVYNQDTYRALYCPVRNQYILHYSDVDIEGDDVNVSFVYDITYRLWTKFDGLSFISSAILSGGSQGDNVNLLVQADSILKYPGDDITADDSYMVTKDIFLDFGKIDRLRLQYSGDTAAILTYQLDGEARNGDPFDTREHIIDPLQPNVWRGAGNLGFGRMANLKVADAEEVHSIMFDVKLKGGE